MNYGTYEYFLNGKPTGNSENFHIEILPDGAKMTTSVRDAAAFGTKIRVEAIERAGRFECFEIRFQNKRHIRAVYEFSADKFHFTRTLDGEKTDDETLDLPADTIAFPLLRVFQGETIVRVAAVENFATVLVPFIENLNDTENLLRPTFDERRAENMGRESIAVYQKNSITQEANIYRYFSKHYDDNSRFWINDDGLLVAYRFVQSADKIWEVSLESTL